MLARSASPQCDPRSQDPSATLPPDSAAAAAAPSPDDTTTRRTSDSGILARARAGAYGARPTPQGSAGRIRPSAPPSTSQPTEPSASPDTGSRRPTLGQGQAGPVRSSRRSPSSKPRVGQQITPFGAPDTRPPARKPPLPPLSRRTHQTIIEDDDDSPTVLSSLVDHEEDADLVSSPSSSGVPDPERIQDQWLRDAVVKAEQLGQSFPVQAQIAYSKEPNLPFTLMINRATPAMAVRAMVNFVEFLAGIYTPPRARIELHGVAHLDKSFHRNVEAALEPYFGNNVVVEPTTGTVDIRFTDPDPGWGQYPKLPLR